MVEYGDYIAERAVLIQELKDLLDEKEEIMSKYTKITSTAPKTEKKLIYNEKSGKSIVKIGIDENFTIKGKNKINRLCDEYLIELEEKNIMSKEKILREKINALNIKIKKLEKPLSKVCSIEKKIYKKMLEGNSVTHSVELVTKELSLEEDPKRRKDIRTVWRYYNKLRVELKKEGILRENDIKL